MLFTAFTTSECLVAVRQLLVTSVVMQSSWCIRSHHWFWVREEKEGEVREAFKKALKFSEYTKKNVQLLIPFFFYASSDNPQLCTNSWLEYLTTFTECIKQCDCQIQVIFFPVAPGFKISSVVRGLRDLPNTCGFPSHPFVKTAIESLS